MINEIKRLRRESILRI